MTHKGRKSETLCASEEQEMEKIIIAHQIQTFKEDETERINST